MRPPVAALPFAVFIVVLLVAGCGGGGSSAGSSSTEPKARPEKSGSSAGPVKKATAPRAPAGSKVIACSRGDAPAQGDRAEVTGLRAAGTSCGAARAAMRRWQQSSACRLGEGASRASCSLGAYRCQAIEVDRGAAVSCARADGGDVSFVARRRR